MSEQEQQEQQGEETPEDAIQGEQGEPVEQDAVTGAGLDPDVPVRTSAPPPEAQSGVPNLPDGSNEGVEPGEEDEEEES